MMAMGAINRMAASDPKENVPNSAARMRERMLFCRIPQGVKAGSKEMVEAWRNVSSVIWSSGMYSAGMRKRIATSQPTHTAPAREIRTRARAG
jgi:hypothetical protein